MILKTHSLCKITHIFHQGAEPAGAIRALGAGPRGASLQILFQVRSGVRPAPPLRFQPALWQPFPTVLTVAPVWTRTRNCPSEGQQPEMQAPGTP